MRERPRLDSRWLAFLSASAYGADKTAGGVTRLMVQWNCPELTGTGLNL
jgi:hypothetical protein